MKDILVDRFIKYAKIDTKSDEESPNCPSSPKIMDFAKKLRDELIELGLEDVELDEHAYLYATLPANTDEEKDVLGLIAHMDTSPDMSGENVKPRIVEKYDGKDIVLNEEENIILSPNDFPELNDYVGDDLIVTDGTTLLGADDKAGVAEIVTAMEYFIKNPDIKHGKIRIAFTPDEEIGRGADLFDVKKFGADYAFTIDGGPLGEIEYENFNAASAKITIKGRNVHPGSAKNKMINSQLVAMEYNAMLPVNERPEYTEGYEGFILLTSIKGTVEETQMHYIIRDFTKEGFASKKCLMKDAQDYINYKYNEAMELDIKDSYYNMYEKIEPRLEIVELAKKAMVNAGVEPMVTQVRGGTDGARLSFMGLPCPNIFTGGMNYHGRYEYASIQSMEKAFKTVVELVKLVW